MILTAFPLMRLVKFLGKVQFTMILLLFGIVIMTIGTVVESRESRDLAQGLIYGAFWFDLFLLLIAVNLVMAVVNRIPIRRRQWPVVFTHLAIVVLLIGCWISHTFGYEGRMIILESGEESRIVLDANEIRARWQRQPDASTSRAEAPAVSEASFSLAPGRPIHAGELQREAEGRPGLRVVDHVERGMARLTLGKAGPEGAPGIEVGVLGPRLHAHEWLVADGQSEHRKRLGPIDVEFLVARAEQAFEFLAAPAPAQTRGDSGTILWVQPKRGGDPVRIPLPESVGREIACGAGVVARVERLLLRARLANGRLVDVPTAELNPAAIVVVESGGRSERHTVFARFPDFSVTHGSAKGEELVGEIRLEASPELDARTLVTVILGPGDRLYTQLTSPGGGRTRAAAMAVGQQLAVGGRDLAFELKGFLERARPEVVVARVPEGQEGGRAYLRLEASLDGRHESFWLGLGRSEVLGLGSHVLEVAFDRQTRPLPFAIALEEFEVIYHPGSTRPAEYRSVVQVKSANGDRPPRDEVISMNRPLDEAGWRLFQSSYRLGRDGQPDATILSASYDPGVPVVYVSFALIVLGIAWYVQGQRRRLRTPAPETSGKAKVLGLEGPLSGSTVHTAQTAA